MKRRKNSWISSSSMPGTCGKAPRRTAWVVLMFTTAFPCSSTRRVKSGKPCVWASAVAQNAASHRAGRALRTRMFDLLMIFYLSLLLRAAVFDRIRNALHAHGWRFSDHCHPVVGHFAGIDVDGAHAGEPRRGAAALERFDEHRDRRQAIRIHHLPDR